MVVGMTPPAPQALGGAVPDLIKTSPTQSPDDGGDGGDGDDDGGGTPVLHEDSDPLEGSSAAKWHWPPGGTATVTSTALTLEVLHNLQIQPQLCSDLSWRYL